LSARKNAVITLLGEKDPRGLPTKKKEESLRVRKGATWARRGEGSRRKESDYAGTHGEKTENHVCSGEGGLVAAAAAPTPPPPPNPPKKRLEPEAYEKDNPPSLGKEEGRRCSPQLKLES